MSERTLLFVEDEPDDYELAKIAFDKAGLSARLVAAADGQEALDYLFREGRYKGRQESTDPALVVLDLKLPKIGGFEVLRRVRADPRTKKLAVVVLTSSPLHEDRFKALAAGANLFLTKPIDFGEYVIAAGKIRALLEALG